jgi:2-hydroxychromene-2-carboxylate isomerase
MARTVEFFFDYGSPWSYIGYTQLPKLEAESAATVVLRPMLLGGVFKATGNHAPLEVPAKFAWTGKDLARFANRYGVEFRRNPHFPIITVTLMRGAVAAAAQDRLPAYSNAVFRAIWVDGLNMNDRSVVAEVLARSGFDPEQLLAATETQPVKDKLRADTEEAVRRGVFGAPTYFVGEEMFFGQDRADFVAEALAAG